MSYMLMAPSTWHMGVRRIPGPRNDSDAGARVDAPARSNGSTHDQTTDGRSASFSIHYSDIHGLCSNFSFVEYHLASSLPNLLLLSETKLSGIASPNHFNISLYKLFSHLILIAVYVLYLISPWRTTVFVLVALMWWPHLSLMSMSLGRSICPPFP